MTLYDECVDAAAVLHEMARITKPSNIAHASYDIAQRWERNLDKWGTQPMETLFIVLAEEVGEIARAILEGDTDEVRHTR